MNLAQMINDLVDAGMSESEIASRAKTSQPTIHRIKNNLVSSPSYKVGKAIEAIYSHRIKSSVPRSNAVAN